MNALLVLALTMLAAGSVTEAALPEGEELRDEGQVEKRLHEIWPDLFGEDAAKKFTGTQVRFRTSPLWPIKVDARWITIEPKKGTTVRVSNFSTDDRRKINMPHKAPMTIVVEGQISAIDRQTRTISIEATKVLVKW